MSYSCHGKYRGFAPLCPLQHEINQWKCFSVYTSPFRLDCKLPTFFFFFFCIMYVHMLSFELKFWISRRNMDSVCYTCLLKKTQIITHKIVLIGREPWRLSSSSPSSMGKDTNYLHSSCNMYLFYINCSLLEGYWHSQYWKMKCQRWLLQTQAERFLYIQNLCS